MYLWCLWLDTEVSKRGYDEPGDGSVVRACAIECMIAGEAAG